MALWVKPLPATLAIKWMQILFLLARLLLQLPVDASGKAKEDSPSAWTPASMWGDLDGVPDSRFQSVPALVIEAFGESINMLKLLLNFFL